MKTFYEVSGRTFVDLKEAKEYEKELAEKKEKEEKLAKEKEVRMAEIKKLEEKLEKLRKDFMEDYGYAQFKYAPLDEFFKDLFNL